MIGLAKETYRTMEETWKLWEKLYEIDRKSPNELSKRYSPEASRIKPEIGTMLLLDPGSLAFDFPKRYGYRLLLKRFEDYYAAMSMPSWDQWISFETKFLTKRDLVDLTLRSLEQILYLKERIYAFYKTPLDRARLNFERFKIRINYLVIEEVKRIFLSKSQDERTARLRALEEAVTEYTDLGTPSQKRKFMAPDPYGYRQVVEKIVHQSIGLTDGY